MFIQKIIDLIYPPVCGICGKAIKNNKNTCGNCLSILKCCQVRIIHGGGNHFFDVGVLLFPYVGIIRTQLLKFKFHHQKYIKNSFAQLLAIHLNKLHFHFDIIVPVPISKKRYLERGFNQSEEVAKRLAKILKIKLNAHALLKIRNNQTQSSLNRFNRYTNVKGVYRVKSQSDIKGKAVLLLDDIYTTGATVNECAKVLKENGAKKVIVVTIAYA